MTTATKPKTIKPVRPSAGEKDWLRVQLQGLIKAMHESVLYWVKATWRKAGLATDGLMPPPELQFSFDGDVPGHEFHGNQWTGGGGESMHAMSPLDNIYKERGERALPKIQKAVDAEVKAQGYPSAKVKVVGSISDDGVRSSFGGRVIGICTLTTGKIQVSAEMCAGKSAQYVRGVVAHEIGHAVFEKEYQKHLFRGNSVLDRVSWVTLKKEDGVSDYSRATWKDQGKKIVSEKCAVHETFAEIHKIRSIYGKTAYEQTVKPAWREVYEQTMKTTKVLK